MAGGSQPKAWHQTLRHLRESVGLSRIDAAARANVSPITLKAYELGTRNPSRESLAALLTALQADPLTRAGVLEGAGFARDGEISASQRLSPWHTFDEAAAVCFQTPIPSCLTNQFMELVAANGLLQRVLEEDLNHSRTGHYERSFLAMLTRRSVADHLLNWDEAMTIPIRIAKGHYGGDVAAMRDANPYFAGAVEHLLAGDPPYVQRFLALWMTVPPREEKYRWSYPIRWQRSNGDVLSFHVTVSPCDELNSAAFNDWAPVDAVTAAAIDALRLAADEYQDFRVPLAG
ncbi:MAG: helix-turn-helix transcriptional regulator [Dehalococcoidia bacterium]|nr:helix-turn-helix transcriptional regulator [Dehalococcoidia bacterium]MCB9486518.1 helix-turn-helix transcriptional regulator [Thermoflexaceae bacterium]